MLRLNLNHVSKRDHSCFGLSIKIKPCIQWWPCGWYIHTRFLAAIKQLYNTPSVCPSFRLLPLVFIQNCHVSHYLSICCCHVFLCSPNPRQLINQLTKYKFIKYNIGTLLANFARSRDKRSSAISKNTWILIILWGHTPNPSISFTVLRIWCRYIAVCHNHIISNAALLGGLQSSSGALKSTE